MKTITMEHEQGATENEEQKYYLTNSMDYMSRTPLRSPRSFVFSHSKRSNTLDFVRYLLDKYQEDNIWRFEICDVENIRPSTEFFDEYVFGRVIGRGGDGIVYKEANRALVIKQVNIWNDEFNTFCKLAASLQEMRMLKETGIATLHAMFFDIENNIIYKVYDQFEVDLACVFRDNFAFSEVKTKKIIKKLCEKIATLHENNYIHGDLKPENILRGRDGSWNLIDFDRAKYCKTGTVINATFGGTFGFTAPELIHHGGTELNQIDHGVDVFACALLIIYCINGGHLGDCEVDIALRSKYNKAVCDGNYALMQEIFKAHYHKLFVANFGMSFVMETRRLVKEKKISAMLCDLLNKMLAKDAVERLSMSEVLTHEWFKNMNQENEEIDLLLEYGKENKSFEIVEECVAYQSMYSHFGSLQVTDAYNGDSLVEESDYNDLLNGSTSVNDDYAAGKYEYDGQAEEEEAIIYDYDEEEVEEEDEVKKMAYREYKYYKKKKKHKKNANDRGMLNLSELF